MNRTNRLLSPAAGTLKQERNIREYTLTWILQLEPPFLLNIAYCCGRGIALGLTVGGLRCLWQGEIIPLSPPGAGGGAVDVARTVW